jgi:hypothetical protein
MVNIGTRLHVGQPDFDSHQGQGFFFLPPCSYWVWGPSSVLFDGCLVLFPAGYRGLGHEADHWPSSTKIKYVWSYTSIPLYIFMVLCLIKHRDNTYTRINIHVFWCSNLLALFPVYMMFSEFSPLCRNWDFCKWLTIVQSIQLTSYGVAW